MKRLRILIADDETSARELLRRMLEREGHSVVTVGSGREAIAAFQQALREGKAFDLVITDLGMPQGDGRQVVQMVKSLASTTFVAVFSGWDARQGEEWSRWVDYFLPKPLTRYELQELLRKATTSLLPR